MTHFTKPPNSKNKVAQAGKRIANNEDSDEDLELLDKWRASHGYVLNTFQILIRRRLDTYGIDAQFAQRLKRKRTVIDKIRRTSANGEHLIKNVTTMNDFAGCRLIFNTLDDLHIFRNRFREDAVNHKLKNSFDKYDYINNPKSSGYRGIHDVFEHYPRPHRANDRSSLPWHGLLVEIQYRTTVQQAWATAVELSDLIDNRRTKFRIIHDGNALNDDHASFFAHCSEFLARQHEQLNSCLPHLADQDLRNSLETLEQRLQILYRLKALQMVQREDDLGKHNVLKIILNEKTGVDLEVFKFGSRRLAIEYVQEMEADSDIVDALYVAAGSATELRSAYRNFFSDAQDFLDMMRPAKGE